MMLRRGSLASRLLAVALLGAVLLAGYALVVSPVIAAYQEVGQGIEQSQLLLQRYRSLAGERPQLSARLAELEQRAARAGGYLKGSSDALAAAELQDQVRAIIEGAGGSLRSTQILPASPIDATVPLRKAALRIQLGIDIEGLQKVLYDLETGQPYLFVDQLTIRPQRTRRRSSELEVEPVLDVSFEVFGYVRAAAA
jgi:general secretion pathway protein M